MICDSNGVRAAVEMGISGEDFYSPAHKEIYYAIEELYNAGKPINYITLKNRLTEKDLLEKAQGQKYIAHLSALVSTSVQTPHYVKIVQDMAVRRRLINASGEISDASFGGAENVDDALDIAEKLYKLESGVKL